MDKLQVLINGQLQDAKTASLGIDDLSIVRGYGIFDYFKTVKGHPIFWEDNLDRFFYCADKMDLVVLFSREELKKQITILMEANSIPESGIKLLLTGGYSEDGYTVSTPNLVITQQPLTRNIEGEQNGIKLITYDFHRAFGTVKTIDYVMGIQALKTAKSFGADDVVYTKDGLVSECPRSNVFIVDKNGKILTPGNEVLGGITKLHILKMLEGLMDIEVRDITVTELENAAEVFITSTSKNITPVISVGAIAYGVGPITRKLQAMLEPLIYG